MIRRCAWCDSTLGEVAPPEIQTITHGICLPCAEVMLASACHASEHTEPMLAGPIPANSGSECLCGALSNSAG
jgi:hypothetical protein